MKALHLLAALVLLLPACRGTDESTASDPLFGLRLAGDDRAGVAPPAPARVPQEAPVPDADPPPASPGAEAFRVEMTFHRADGANITYPPVLALPGQPVNVSSVDKISYLQDFDVEIACAAQIGDPVIGMFQTGVQVELVADPVEGSDRIAVRWVIVLSSVAAPIRERTITLAPESRPITIQLPVTPVTRCEGRTKIVPGQQTLLAEVPLDPETGGVTSRVTIRVEPAAYGPEPDRKTHLGSQPEVHTPAALLGPADPNAPPPSGGWLEIIVAERLDDPAEVHLDPIEAARPLKRFEVRAGAEVGTAVSCHLKEAYLSGYRIVSTDGHPTVDPQVGHYELGFAAHFTDRGATPTLAWRLSTGFLATGFSSNVTGTDLMLPLEIPLTTEKSGRLILTGENSSMEMARTEDGRRIVLVVRRVFDAEER